MAAHEANIASNTECDTRSHALALMTQALQLLDSEAAITALAGAHLQMAIDSLWRDGKPNSSSLHLH
jgi:hypothetical protein